MTARILAIDLGTSCAKGLLIGLHGEILARSVRDYPTLSPREGWAEQSPEEVLAAVRSLIEELAPVGVDLVFAAAMHSLLAVDGGGRPLCPAMTWADTRSLAEARELRASDAARGLHQRTGTPIHPASPICKIAYIARRDPDLFAKSARFISLKEFVIENLTGARVIDLSTASATGLLDVRSGTWDEEALAIAGIDAERLSPIASTMAVLADSDRDRRIVLGASDGALATVGVGAASAATACVTLGTSGAARLIVPEPETDPEGRLFCYALDDERFVIGGAISTGGIVLRWLRGEYGFPSDKAVVDAAATAPRGCKGLTCQPRVLAERYPSYSAATGIVFHGRRPEHSHAHDCRAALEGAFQAFVPLLDELETDDAPFEAVRIGGGAFEWPFCRQLFADVTGRCLEMPAIRESSALGAARLGFHALGETVDWSVAIEHSYDPDPEAAAFYAAARENAR